MKSKRNPLLTDPFKKTLESDFKPGGYFANSDNHNYSPSKLSTLASNTVIEMAEYSESHQEFLFTVSCRHWKNLLLKRLVINVSTLLGYYIREKRYPSKKLNLEAALKATVEFMVAEHCLKDPMQLGLEISMRKRAETAYNEYYHDLKAAGISLQIPNCLQATILHQNQVAAMGLPTQRLIDYNSRQPTESDGDLIMSRFGQLAKDIGLC